MTSQPQLGPPPRVVSRSLALQVRFGGGATLAGWILVASASLFALVLFNVARVDTGFYKFRGKLRQVPATITKVEGTSAWGRPGGKPIKGSSRQYYRVSFRYVTKKGVKHTGVSYGKQLPWPKRGDKVTVEYPRRYPAHARIEGLTRGIVDEGFMFILLFPLMGLILGICGILWGGRNLALLRKGQPAFGRLIHKELIDFKNRKYRMTFEFQAQDGSVHRTELVTQAAERLEDDPWERLLYKPTRPSTTVLLDNLPGSPLITPSGGLDSARPGRTKWVLLAPLVSAVALPVLLIWFFA